MNLFFDPDINLNHPFFLSEEESRHCAQVLRMKEGDLIYITDGKGNLYECEVTIVQVKKCAAIIKSVAAKIDEMPRLHVAIAPTKNMDRMEWFVEKSVEMGIYEITPIICNRSERRIIKIERLQKVAIAAMKQSLKTFLPKINEPCELKNLLKQTNYNEKFICFGETAIEDNINKSYSAGSNALFLIGPEGDFTSSEIEQAIASEFKPINLGWARLRTETAAIYVTASFKFMNFMR